MSKEQPRPKRQHILPRFLLEGLSRERKKGQNFVFVYRKDRDPYPANICEAAAENYFYGKAGEEWAEDDLAKHETAVAPVIARIRNTRVVEPGDGEALAKLVGMLIVRTKSVRVGMYEATTSLTSGLLDELRDGKVVEFLKAKTATNPELIRDAIRQALKLPSNAPIPKELELALSTEMIRQIESQPGMFDKLFEAIGAGLQSALSTDKIKTTHVSTIKRVAERLEGEMVYKTFSWSTTEWNESSLILGDLGPMGITKEGTIESPLRLGPRMAEVVLPITSHLMIVGLRPSAAFYPIDGEALCIETASRCLEYFVSQDEDDSRRSMASSIGSKSELLTADEREKMIRDTLA